MLTPPAIPYFETLGHFVEARWAEHHYNEDNFCDISRAAFDEHPPPDSLGGEELIGWVLARSTLAGNRDPRDDFGEPPITVFEGRRFYIEAIFWMDGTTPIHQHGFSGAFIVVAGSSLQMTYAWTTEHTVNSHFLFGELTPVATRLLARGEPVVIEPGARFIHSIFHLERPTVTLVIRTRSDRRFDPQFSYAAPHVACDPFHTDRLLRKQIRLLETLHAIDHPEFEKQTQALIAGVSLDGVFEILMHLQYRIDAAVLERLLAGAKQRHGPLVGNLPPVFREWHRQRCIVELRGAVVDRDLRFFLGLLFGAPDRARALNLVTSTYGDEPVFRIVDWIAELVRVQTMRSSADGNATVLTETERDALTVMLTRNDFEELVTDLSEKYGRDQIMASMGDLRDFHENMRSSPLFINLLGT